MTPVGLRDDEKRRFELGVKCLTAGMTRRVAVAMMMGETGCGEDAANATVSTILAGWADDLTGDLPKAKAAQVERLCRDLVRMRTASSPNYRSIAAHEELVSKLLGTQAPMRVEVDASLEVRHSLLAIVSSLTAEEQARIVDEQLALEERARAPRGLPS